MQKFEAKLRKKKYRRYTVPKQQIRRAKGEEKKLNMINNHFLSKKQRKMFSIEG
jgi:hypothetical protein